MELLIKFAISMESLRKFLTIALNPQDYSEEEVSILQLVELNIESYQNMPQSILVTMILFLLALYLVIHGKV
jgi:hypothetical protein